LRRMGQGRACRRAPLPRPAHHIGRRPTHEKRYVLTSRLFLSGSSALNNQAASLQEPSHGWDWVAVIG
jgi:hypothetical protein